MPRSTCPTRSPQHLGILHLFGAFALSIPLAACQAAVDSGEGAEDKAALEGEQSFPGMVRKRFGLLPGNTDRFRHQQQAHTPDGWNFADRAHLQAALDIAEAYITSRGIAGETVAQIRDRRVLDVTCDHAVGGPDVLDGVEPEDCLVFYRVISKVTVERKKEAESGSAASSEIASGFVTVRIHIQDLTVSVRSDDPRITLTGQELYGPLPSDREAREQLEMYRELYEEIEMAHANGFSPDDVHARSAEDLFTSLNTQVFSDGEDEHFIDVVHLKRPEKEHGVVGRAPHLIATVSKSTSGLSESSYFAVAAGTESIASN